LQTCDCIIIKIKRPNFSEVEKMLFISVLQSCIIFLRFRLLFRVKILMRLRLWLRLLPNYIAGYIFSVAELHHFYAAPAPSPSQNFDAAPALASSPTPLYSRPILLKNYISQQWGWDFFLTFFNSMIKIVVNMNKKKRITLIQFVTFFKIHVEPQV
jgi:hypothetical protein